MSQLLAKFQTVFSSEPVRIEFSEFAKDGAFSADDIRALKDEGLDAIYFKPLSAAESAKLQASVAGLEGKKDFHNVFARMVAPCWCDADGNLIGKADEIGQLPAGFVTALFKKVQKLNGLDTEAIEAAGKG